ncbi:MAG: hypothetical protein IT379_31050 [Deltaproteobacteria bacterium]|nr:hypothetical protein [Deltaproteobacteria bacterium]
MRLGTAPPRWLCLAVAAFGAACGEPPEPRDAGADGGGSQDMLVVEPPDARVDEVPDARTPPTSCNEPVDGESCAMCEGTLACGVGGSENFHCCGGRWQGFFDGPCRPNDAGSTTCAEVPDLPGCPCSTEGEVLCDGRFSAARVCMAGTWRHDVRRACC